MRLTTRRSTERSHEKVPVVSVRTVATFVQGLALGFPATRARRNKMVPASSGRGALSQIYLRKGTPQES